MTAFTEPRVRIFIATALDPGLIEQLLDIQRELRDALPGGSVRWIKPSQFHLTLKFLGAVSPDLENLNGLAAALRRACNGMAAFRLVLDGMGCFPNSQNPRILWRGINGALEALGTLQKRIEHEARDFGDRNQERTFQPHLTLGRVRAFGKEARQVGEAVERLNVPVPGEWTVRQIHLMQSVLSSEGARYVTLDTIPLPAGTGEISLRIRA